LKKILQKFITRISLKDGAQSDPDKQLSTAGGAQDSNSSSFGRIQKHTEELFKSQIKLVVEPVLSYLPLNVSKEMRDWTAKTVLDTVLKDWRENGNLDPLTQEDVADLGSFVELAVYLTTTGDDGLSTIADKDLASGSTASLKFDTSAFKSDSNQLVSSDTGRAGAHPLAPEKVMGQAGERLMMTGEGSAIYKATLESLLYDWLHNWNANGNSGPQKCRE